MLEVRELQVFLVAAETENFSETARRLDMSQPAVSAQIQALEEKLNMQLFDRIGRSIKLNDVGEAALPAVRKLLREAQSLEEMITSQQGTIYGLLAVGCSTAAGKYILPKIMARFMAEHPQVRVTCRVGPRNQALERLTAGEVDLAISSLRIPRRTVEYRHFADDLLVLIAPPTHPWAKAGQIAPDSLIEHPIILRESSSGTAITLNRELAVYDMNLEMLQTRLVLENTEAIVQAVCEGIGPAFVSQVAAVAALQAGLVATVPIAGLQLIQRLFMARPTDSRTSEVQQAFWDFTFAPENDDLRPIINKE